MTSPPSCAMRSYRRFFNLDPKITSDEVSARPNPLIIHICAPRSEAVFLLDLVLSRKCSRLFRTCRKIHEEASCILFSEGRFSAVDLGLPLDWPTLHPLRSQYLRQVRHLKVVLDVVHYNVWHIGILDYIDSEPLKPQAGSGTDPDEVQAIR